MDVSGEVNFYTPCEIETSLDRRADYSEILKSYHERAPLPPMRECDSSRASESMDNRVRPPSPVFRGPQAVPIPGGSFEKALLGNQVAMQMLRENLAIGTPLAHW